MRDRIIAAFDGRPSTRLSPAGRSWEELSPATDGAAPALRPAAVLVPLLDRREGMTVLLTRRTDHLNAHAGQISFPGGRREEDDPSPEITALREAEEEIALARESVHVIGRLGVRETGTGFKVVPVVGLIDPPVALSPDPSEVAEVFEVPLEFLLAPGNHRIETRVQRGIERQFYVIPYESYHIWGLTARLLVTLSEVIGR